MVLYLGRIMEIGPTADVYERPRHPYTAALLSAAPGAQRRERIVLQGEIPSPSNPPSAVCFARAVRSPFRLRHARARARSRRPAAPEGMHP